MNSNGNGRDVGRPRSTMTPDNCEAVLRNVRFGLHPDRAAQAAGISASTMRAHKRRHPEFATALKEAAAQAEQHFLSRILRHSESQWTAAAWMLERRFPERWRKREQADVRMDVKAKVEHGPEAPRGDALRRYLEQLALVSERFQDPRRN